MTAASKPRKQASTSRNGEAEQPIEPPIEPQEPDRTPGPEEAAPCEPREAEQAEVLQQLAELEDRLLRMAAEHDNQRKRRDRELRERLRFACEPIVRDLLPVLDSLERAVQTGREQSENPVVHDGVVMIRQQLHQVLEKAGVERIEPTGEVFDPHRHEAMAMMPDEQVPADHVITVTEPGWLLHERVIRPARVVVSAGSLPQQERG